MQRSDGLIDARWKRLQTLSRVVGFTPAVRWPWLMLCPSRQAVLNETNAIV